jgi:hypothetical protein
VNGDIGVEAGRPNRRRRTMPDANRRRFDLLPVIVLVAVLGVIGLGVLLFPYALDYVHRQDCIASGRVDCG